MGRKKKWAISFLKWLISLEWIVQSRKALFLMLLIALQLPVLSVSSNWEPNHVDWTMRIFVVIYSRRSGGSVRSRLVNSAVDTVVKDQRDLSFHELAGCLPPDEWPASCRSDSVRERQGLLSHLGAAASFGELLANVLYTALAKIVSCICLNSLGKREKTIMIGFYLWKISLIGSL